MGPMNQVGDLLPPHDPPVRWPSRIVVWATVLLAVTVLVILCVISGHEAAVSFFRWFIVLAIVFVLFHMPSHSKATGTKADDAVLREEVRRWRDAGDRGR
jgi:hypothetical protein